MAFFELTEEQLIIEKTMRDFVQREVKPLDLELDESPEGEVNWGLIRKACEIGLMSSTLPRLVER